MPDTCADVIRKAASVLKDSDAVLIGAGAGMGVDSGLPDFRGKSGFWKAYPPIAKLGISFSGMANPRWFKEDPELAWAFYGHRLHLYRRTEPHEGFSLLLALAREKKGGYFVFTSNVDGHFQKVGFGEERVEECHGSINHLHCVRICTDSIWDAEKVTVDVNMDLFKARDPLPVCPRCGGLARPNVLMFGDWSWVPDRTEAQNTRLQRWLNDLVRQDRSLCIIEIGAGLAVPTVRGTCEQLARHLAGTLIRINPRDHQVPSSRHVSIPLGGLEGIRRIVAAMGDK